MADRRDMETDDEDEDLNGAGSPQFEEPQDPEERRNIRIKYRSLLNDVSNTRAELVSGDTVLLKEKIDTTNAIFEFVRHPREAALDAQCCASIAQLGKQKAQQLATGFNDFSTVEFCEKLITRLGRSLSVQGSDAPQGVDREGWIRLGTASQTFFRRSPAIHFMYGALNLEKKSKPKTDKTSKDDEKADKNAAASRPKELNGFGGKTGEEKGESTTIEVENVLKTLRLLYKKNQRSPICYFEFVVNPDSFSQTIENVFYTSFLIRDGYARMFLDDDELPVIEPVEGDAVGLLTEGVTVDDGDCHQMVMGWTMSDWREIVKSFDITKPLIPTRATAPRPSGHTPGKSSNGSTSKAASTSKSASASSSSLSQSGSKFVKPASPRQKTTAPVESDSDSDSDEPVKDKHSRKR